MAPPRKKNGSIDWDDLIQSGENPNDIVGQTSNETVRNANGMPPQDWKWNQSADGPRWNDGFQNKPDFGEPVAATPKRKRR